MNDLILRQDAIDAIRTAYFDKDIQSAKDDPCIVDAMTDWAIRQIKSVPALVGDIVRTLDNGILVFTTESLDWFNRIVLEDGKMNKKEFYPNDNWIPCSEKLPEVRNAAYLATVDYGEFGVETGQRFFYNKEIGWDDDAVVAWMPLPQPWKGDNDEV